MEIIKKEQLKLEHCHFPKHHISSKNTSHKLAAFPPVARLTGLDMRDRGTHFRWFVYLPYINWRPRRRLSSGNRKEKAICPTNNRVRGLSDLWVRAPGRRCQLDGIVGEALDEFPVLGVLFAHHIWISLRAFLDPTVALVGSSWASSVSRCFGPAAFLNSY